MQTPARAANAHREPLYGRSALLERARSALERAGRGSGGLLLFTGEPGIGKSRLAEQVAEEAAERGWTVAWGRCWEAGGAPAYWPWIQVFRSLAIVEDPFAESRGELAAGAAEARFAAFDRAVRALVERTARQPLLIVLDDLHAADAASLSLLSFLARELSHAPLLVVGAYREAELVLSPESAALLAKVARDGQLFPLSRLSLEDVAAWLRAARAESSPGGAEELYRWTEGHPLCVVEALRLPALGTEAGTWPGEPGSALGAVLDERLGALPQETRSLLAVAAVLGREFSVAQVAAMAGVSPDQAVTALRAALATSILVRTADAEGFRFSHVLLRDRSYRELLPSERAALHVRAGTLLLEQGGDAQAASHHFFEGQSAVHPERVAEVALDAARAALSGLAFEAAVRFGRRALSLPGALSDRLRIELRLAVAEALIRLGETPEGQVLAEQAAELAERVGLDELLAHAALVYATELSSGIVDPKMVALLRRALAGLDESDSPLRARVMARLAAALTPPLDAAHGPEIVALMREALAMARRGGQWQTLLYVLQYGATVGLLVPEAERLEVVRETVELARARGQRLIELLTLPTYMAALIACGERSRAVAELPAYDEVLADFRQPLHRLRRLLVDALLATLAGEQEHAEQASREAQLLAQRSGSNSGWFLWLVHRLSVAQLRRAPELLAPYLGAWLDYGKSMPSIRPYLAWLLAASGRREEALAQLRELEALLVPSAVHFSQLMTFMGAAEAFVALGDREQAEPVYPLLLQAADRMFWNLGPGALLGPTARTLGDLARLLGRTADAVRHYDEAIQACEQLPAPPLVELCRQARAAALAEAALEPAPAPARSRPPEPRSVRLEREGDVWVLLAPPHAPLRLKHSKGLSYLHRLLGQPGQQLHVVELAGVEQRTGDAGAVLDARAKAEYARRVEDLRAELAEAEEFGDGARAARAARELDAIAEQLAGAVGLGGRDRRAASDVERIRINVQRRLKDVIDRIAAADPELGRYLGATLKTGTYCVYQPL